MKQPTHRVSNLQSFPSTLVELLRSRADQHPERLVYRFLQDGGAEEISITYGELDRQARAIGAWLEDVGARGERAVLLYPPGLDYIAAFFGCLYAGVTAVPAYPPRLNRPVPRIQSIVADSRAAFALTTSSILHNIEQRFEHAPDLQALHWLETEQIPPGLETDWRRPAISADTLAFLQYTSGSTSQPKGVMLSHGNLIHNLEAIRRGFQIDSSAAGVFWLPSYHDMGLIGGILEPVYISAYSNLMSPVSFLQRPLRWLEAISRYRATITGAPNFAYDLCVDKITAEQIESLDLSSLSLAFCGAEPIRPETLERFARAFAGCGFRKTAFYPCFGMAESTLIVSGGEGPAEPRTFTVDRKSLERDLVIPYSREEAASLTLVSCGKSIIDQEIVIANPVNLEKCKPGQVGEIWVSGPSVAQGYWALDAETKQTFQAYLADTGDGPFLRTGDLGFLKDEELYVTGRLKDLIIIHGSNHYPHDIERTVENSHAALQPGAGAAFSVTEDGSEKLVIVQEVTRQQRNPDVYELTSAIRRAIAEKHDLQVFAIVLVKPMSIPKTSSGKIQRRACKKSFLEERFEVVGEWRAKTARSARTLPPSDEQRLTTVPEPDKSRAESIQSWLIARIAEMLGTDAADIDPRQPFTYYGLGSVQAVSLTGELEIFLTRKLAPTLAWDYPTIELLANYLAREPQIVKSPEASAQPVQTFTRSLNEPIAIIGLSCRFPGASNPQAFWELLRNGVDAISEVPSDRWDVDEFYSAEPGSGKVTTRWGGFLEGVDLFDPHFFGISPREAAHMDPQHRLLLEVSWEALENALIPPDSLAGSRTGVFVGISSYDYSRLQFDDPDRIDAYAGIGNAHSIAANRLSYTFDLRGPSMAVDTACSSSLVAVHLACQSLRSGESDLALAGGVNLILTPELTITFSQARMLSPDGRCKTFDAGANGYVRGEGCGVIVLKRLSDALRDGDPILALVRGSAVNQDGRSNGLTAPNGLAQQGVIRQALSNAGVQPNQIGYVEAHGTGTPLGDPIEIASLRAVLSDDETAGRLIIGSVKTNIGHLESAAGIAGLIKSVLALQYESIPPHLHLKEINPYLSLEDSRIEIGTYLRPWKRREAPRLAGVSSFGFGGTNAHVILSDPPPGVPPADSAADLERTRHLLTLSAKTGSALQELAQGTARYLDQPGGSLADICYTFNTGRSHFEHRLAVQASSNEELKTNLEAFISNPATAATSHTQPGAKKKIAFLFTGQGAQYPGMGRQLYESQPAFRQALDECARILDSILDRPLLEILFETDGASSIHQTAYTQPALFAFEYSLAQMWRSWGIEPASVLGHSVGEYVAACLAGVFNLEDGLRLISERARLMGALPSNGSMVAVFASADRIVDVLEPYQDRASIAATNGPENTVISGETGAVQALLGELAGLGIAAKPLNVSHAFHSPLMDPILDDFEAFAGPIPFSSPRLSLISNVTGEILQQIPDASYWRQHIRAEVKFSAGMNSLASTGIDVFLETGPAPVLLGMGRSCLPESNALWLPSARQGGDAWQALLASLGELYVQGVDVDWTGFDRGYPRRKVSIPNYPFERQRYWLEPGSTHPASRRNTRGRNAGQSTGQNSSKESDAVPALSSPSRSNGNSRSLHKENVEHGNHRKPPPAQTPVHDIDQQKLLVAAPAQRQKLLEGYLRGQAASVLGMEPGRLELNRPLDTLGLDSLMAIELKNRLESKLGMQLSVSSLLQGPTISGLVAQILGDLRQPVHAPEIPSASAADAEGFHPLTYNQQAMWFLDQFMPPGVTFNVSGAVRLLGKLDRSALRRAFAALMDRHAVLRTTFHVVEGQPMQKVHPQLPLPMEEEDATGWKEEALQAHLEDRAFRSFDLEHGPAFRVVLFRRSDRETILLLAIHHVVTDFWSMTLLAAEIMKLYAAAANGVRAALPDLSRTYTEFARWHNETLAGPDGERHWEYWRQQMRGELPVLNLPFDRPRKPLQTYRGETQHFHLSPGLTRRLKEFAGSRGTTAYTVLLAAFQTLLHRYSGQSDILVGSAMAGRNHPDLAGVMGYFVNPVGLRADFSGDPTFIDLLEQVRKTVLDALDHQDFPPALLAERLQIPHRDASRPPLFETTFIYEKAHIEGIQGLNSVALGIPGRRIEMEGLTLESMSLLRQPSQFDLTFMMAETGEEMSSALIYNPDLFDAATIRSMWEHFDILLQGIIAAPDKPVSAFALLSESERRQILMEWNQTGADYPRDLCIYDLVQEQVRRTPNAVAAEFEETSLTYRQLEGRVDQVANVLRMQGVRAGTIVGIFMNRSMEMLVGVLSVLKAGGAYLPLDPAFPSERLAFMLTDSDAALILTQSGLEAKLPDHQAQVICIDRLGQDESPTGKKRSRRPPPPVPASPEDPAYIIYTSGSTGKPKGVLIHQQAAVNLLCSMRSSLGLDPGSVVFAVTTLSFDTSVADLILPLITGARLVIASSRVVIDGALLAQALTDTHATFMQATPASWRLLLEAGWQGKEDLQIVSTGEALTNDLAARLLPRGSRLWNLYGPTETTIWATMYQVTSLDREGVSNTIPIGKPIANTQMYVLDSNMEPVPAGVIGNLYIGGEGISRGYLNRAELTAERFIPDPFDPSSRLYKTGDLARYLRDGNIEFFGRSDHQVKIRGYRIETGEVEVALAGHPDVRQAVVIAMQERSSDAKLAAYVVAARESIPPDAVQLREFLRTKLPEYMVPAIFVNLEALPLTPTGKVDRKALPAVTPDRMASQAEYVAPRTPQEQAIAAICAEVLNLERVGLHDDFFDLGGNSLIATRLIFQLQEHFHVRIPLVRLFESPTIAGLARALDQARESTALDVDLFDGTTLDELKRDVSIDKAIGANGMRYAPEPDPRQILLTGATGFLGAYLLHGLLEKTGASVYCLVRANSKEAGLSRLKRNLEYYQLWDEAYTKRVQVVLGDLEHARFGLSSAQYEGLACELDVIYHNGAMVNFVYPYHALKPVNVDSTHEILRLASTERLKPVHFVSSLSVFMKGDLRDRGPCYENEDLEEAGVPFGGYGQSKWVAEGLMRLAAQRGVPITIFRPDNILGDRRTGILNTNDMTYSLVRAIFKLGSVPDVEIMGGIVPVDFVSDAILHLASQEDSIGKTFHLSMMEQSNFVELFERIAEMGLPIKKVSFAQWKTNYYELAKQFPEEAFHAFLPLINQVGAPRLSLPRLDLSNTLAGLKGSSILYPSVDTGLLETYVKYFVSAGLVSAESGHG